MNVNDMMLRQYIDQVFMRYDFNRTGTLNLQELHIFLNELFRMCGVPRNVGYMEAYQALMQVDCNRDGQVNRFELFNLFKFMTEPGFRPVPYTFGAYSFGGINSCGGIGGIGGFGGIGGIGGFGGINSYGAIRQPVTTTYTTVSSNPVGYGIGSPLVGVGCDPSWNSNWHGWGY